MIVPTQIIHEQDVLPALRGLFSWHPATMQGEPETLARLLWVLNYLPYQPPVFEVEAALEALTIEGEMLS